MTRFVEWGEDPDTPGTLPSGAELLMAGESSIDRDSEVQPSREGRLAIAVSAADRVASAMDEQEESHPPVGEVTAVGLVFLVLDADDRIRRDYVFIES